VTGQESVLLREGLTERASNATARINYQNAGEFAAFLPHAIKGGRRDRTYFLMNSARTSLALLPGVYYSSCVERSTADAHLPADLFNRCAKLRCFGTMQFAANCWE